MKKEKTPRCYSRFDDDRICDVCDVSNECFHEAEIQNKLKRLLYRCKSRQANEGDMGYYYTCENKEMKNERGERKFICRQDIFCFPEEFEKEIRKVKLEKLNQINEIQNRR